MVGHRLVAIYYAVRPTHSRNNKLHATENVHLLLDWWTIRLIWST